MPNDKPSADQLDFDPADQLDFDPADFETAGAAIVSAHARAEMHRSVTKLRRALCEAFPAPVGGASAPRGARPSPPSGRRPARA